MPENIGLIPPVSLMFDDCLGKCLCLNKSYKPIGKKMFYRRKDGKVFSHWVEGDMNWWQEMKLVDPTLVVEGA